MRWFVLFPLALLLIVLLAVPGVALAASPGQTSPVPAPPGLTTPDTKPAVPATAPAPTPEGGPSSPAPANVTNVTNNNVVFPPLPTTAATQGIFQEALTLLLTGLAGALQALIAALLGSGGPGGGSFITSTPAGSTYASPAVADLWSKVRLAADASLALIVAYSGVLIALGKVQRSPYDEALALLLMKVN